MSMNIKPGDRFGMLKVMEDLGVIDGVHKFRCVCDCGNETAVAGGHLKAGQTRSCGCMRKIIASGKWTDVKGVRFGRLMAMEYLGDGYWKCICDCGKECRVHRDRLTTGRTKSCGCYRMEKNMERFKNEIHHVDGTCVERIANRRLFSNNTSGYMGVHQEKSGRYRAYIGFKGRRYNLGTFDTLEGAVEARKEKEDELYGEFLRNYYYGTVLAMG